MRNIGYILRRSHRLSDSGRNIFAAPIVYIEPGTIRFLEKVRVGQGLLKRLAQFGDTFRGHPGWGTQRPAELHAARQEAEYLAWFVRLQLLKKARRVERNDRFRLHIEQNPHAAGRNPLSARIFCTADRIDDAADLVTLHSEHDILRCMIARHDLDIEADHILQKNGRRCYGLALSCRADDEFVLKQIVGAFDA